MAYFRVDLPASFLLASGRVSWANLSRMHGKGKNTSGGLKGFLLTMSACIAVLTAPACATRTKRDPDQSQVRYQLAVGYFQNHREEAAVEELQKSVEADPQNAEAYNMLGLIALKQAYEYEAQAETSSCLKGSDEQLVRADENRKLREAQEHFRKAVELRPSFPEAWNSLSAVALRLQAWDEAIVDAGNALKDATYSQPVFARANLGWAYFHKKDLQNAWKELHEAVSRSPSFCVGRYRLAKVYLERGEIDAAADAIDPVIADGKRCPVQEAFMLAGLLHGRRKDSQKARDLFRTCSDMSPRSCVAEECRRYAQMIQ
jgi:type IV pilus assembly protein PilF